ncbi:MAG: ABC transporter permease [Planctomycetota bacterium]
MFMSALAIASLELRHIVHGKKIFVIGFLVACAVFLGFVVRYYGESPPNDAWPSIYIFMMSLLFLHALVILIPLLFATSLIREEADDGTLVYLFTRPLPKAVILLAKFAAASAVSILLIAGGMLLFHFFFTVFGSKGFEPYDWGGRLWAFLRAGVLGVVGYGAVFTFVGLMTKRALVWGIAYGFLSEFILTMVPAVVGKVTIMHYLRSTALSGVDTLQEKDLDRFMTLTDLVSPTAAAVTILITSAVFLTLSVALVSTREFLETRGAEGT